LISPTSIVVSAQFLCGLGELFSQVFDSSLIVCGHVPTACDCQVFLPCPSLIESYLPTGIPHYIVRLRSARPFGSLLAPTDVHLWRGLRLRLRALVVYHRLRSCVWALGCRLFPVTLCYLNASCHPPALAVFRVGIEPSECASATLWNFTCRHPLKKLKIAQVACALAPRPSSRSTGGGEGDGRFHTDTCFASRIKPYNDNAASSGSFSLLSLLFAYILGLPRGVHALVIESVPIRSVSLKARIADFTNDVLTTSCSLPQVYRPAIFSGFMLQNSRYKDCKPHQSLCLCWFLAGSLQALQRTAPFNTT